MDTIKIPDATLHRRRFFGAAAMSIAAAKLGLLGACPSSGGIFGTNLIPFAA
jgi:hypothetical protein